MICNVVIEGIVTGKVWEYDGDRLFRLAHYPDRDRRGRPLPGNRDQADYFTVRIKATGLPVQVPQEGDLVVVEGYLDDRRGEVTIQEFVRRATRVNGGETPEIPESLAGLAERRSYTEIITERLVVRNGKRR